MSAPKQDDRLKVARRAHQAAEREITRLRKQAANTCSHDWRIDPHFVFSSVPPAYRLVCCKCRSAQIKTYKLKPPYTADLETWPKAQR